MRQHQNVQKMLQKSMFKFDWQSSPTSPMKSENSLAAEQIYAFN